MIIVRMVNGISDKAQKGRLATSVAHNAAAAGTATSSSCAALTAALALLWSVMWGRLSVNFTCSSFRLTEQPGVMAHTIAVRLPLEPCTVYQAEILS